MTALTAHRPPREESGAPRSILVLRGGGLGDLPALAALRAYHPGARILLLGRPWQVDFLTRRSSLVDRVLPVPVSRGVRDPGPGEREDPLEQRMFFRQLQALRPDLALQLHGMNR